MSLIQNDRRMAAETLHDYVMKGTYVTAISLKLIIDHNLFRELGYETQKEYIEGCLPFGESTAYKYLKVATTFGQVLGISFDFEELDQSFSSTALAKLSPVTVDDSVEKVWTLGLSKLYLISSRMESWQIMTLVKSGYIEMKKDFWLGFDELRTMTVKELNEWFDMAEEKDYSLKEIQDIFSPETEKPIWLPVAQKTVKSAYYLKAQLRAFRSFAQPDFCRAAGREPDPRLTEFNLELEDIAITLDGLIERIEYIETEVKK